MSKTKNDAIRTQVRDRYAGIANAKSVGCCGASSPQSSGCCCGGGELGVLGLPEASERLGYSNEEMAVVPEGANMGLGCGNPGAISALKPGETVLDLGSGGGLDCFLAAQKVGPQGQVIGIDMTPDMVSKARVNAEKGGYTNVDFRLGEIEHLPVADNVVDVIMSNCVINLSPDKQAVFKEAFRVLRQNGRLAISDIVAVKPLSDAIKSDMDAYSGCIAGAALVQEICQMLTSSGFIEVSVKIALESSEFIREWFPGSGLEEYVRSAMITAVKPS